ncbi:hypothetical protein NDA11_005517 [Ustilago hordei]|nr:hypothetical protein NDA10_005070 [Ustilago hordei]KAJ1585654.1 hypothetical protein NDA12_000370 [Ustilago hordei]KAJ1588898.1 hypothetical protein NDA15_000213 [Ustilago hordei]KAJ1591045.1 hypothetical protein NDA11_005517 [Ustilago hordei]KAJ1601121.1 hypothetical protein NDA14_007309 [Ustilago hordei]
MFRFRASTSSVGPPANPTLSPFASPAKPSQPSLPTSTSTSSMTSSATADLIPSSSSSSSSILSLLQAHSSASTSTSSISALSPATSLSSLPSECANLTSEPLPTPEPTKATTRVPRASTTTITPRKQQSPPSHAAISPRRATLLTSPRTSRAATTLNAQSSPSPNKSATRRSTIVHTSTDRSSAKVVNMAKKAKVGSAAKSSPFTKASNAAEQTDSNTAAADADAPLAIVTEDEGTPALGTPVTSQSKSADVASSSTLETKQNVVVCVRMRPTRSTSTEAAVWTCDPTKNSILPTEHHPAIAKRTTSSERAGASTSIANHSTPQTDEDQSTYHFQFDKLITAPQTTDDMYHSHIAPVVRATVEGYNGTVFAYGQTGSGKTHTMSGSDDEPGVIPRAVEQVFSAIKEEQSDREFLLRVSYLEIYNEMLKDLLAPLPPVGGERPASPTKGGSSHAAGQSQSSTLRIIEDQKQNRVLITGLSEEIVTNSDAVLDLINRGQEERHVGATDWNERSSRSHCVFTLTIESRPLHTTSSSGKEVRISQLNLIDLAGSERAASQAERRKEGAFINKSLLTLGTVIGKLTEPSEGGDAHVPYRDSKLTRILQTSLSGNARIAVICTLSPDSEHANETLSTLKFGKRCKLVVTTAKKGTAMDDKALLQKYRKELDVLRAKLEANGPSPNPDNVVVVDKVDPAASLESQQKLDELNQQREAAKKEVEDMQKKRSDLKGQIEHLTKLILTSQSVAASESGNAVAGPSTPVRSRPAHAHASALARRGPRMSDFAGSLYNSPISSSVFAPTGEETLSGVKPFELESELAALRRQLRTQIESRQTLIAAHTAELAARDARAAELQEAIRLNEQELDEAEVAYDKLKEERDEARKIALKEQEKARENKKKLLEEQEANRLLKLVAKARAGDEDKAMEEQIERLREQLKLKEAQVADVKERLEIQLREARNEVERERKAREMAERESEEAREAKMVVQGELEAATANADELKEKLAAAENSSNEDEEDVNAEFQNLVRGKAAQDTEAAARLDQRSTELDERERQLEQLRTELEQTRLDLAASQPSPTATRELASLRDHLSASEEERQLLQVEVAKLRATASSREQDASKLAAFDSQLARANAKIAELEKEILAEKARTAEALKTVARPLPVPASVAQDAGAAVQSVPTSPIKAFAGSKLRGLTPETSGAGTGLNRAGSVKEYRRYQPGAADPSSQASPSPAASGSRSAFLSQETFSGGRSATLNSGSAATNKAEKEEIERLNSVINSQRAIMADLEKSVASWKTRMKAQAELIQKLVLENIPSTQSPPTSDGENEETFSSLSSPRRKANFSHQEEGSNTLPRTTHLSLSQHQAMNEPYYGAHTYNRPPPTLTYGVMPGSPHKAGFSANTWSASSPSPLPLPSGNESPSKRKPRKTIEMDLKLLKSSPRVESNKTKFDLDALTAGSRTQDTPTKRRGTAASAYYI